MNRIPVNIILTNVPLISLHRKEENEFVNKTYEHDIEMSEEESNVNTHQN